MGPERSDPVMCHRPKKKERVGPNLGISERMERQNKNVEIFVSFHDVFPFLSRLQQLPNQNQNDVYTDCTECKVFSYWGESRKIRIV